MSEEQERLRAALERARVTTEEARERRYEEMAERLVTQFMIESNRIEGVAGARATEVGATETFIRRASVDVAALCELALIYTPKALLRSSPGMNVKVGSHTPPEGGQNILYKLDSLLMSIEGAAPYLFHCAYEDLHPFMDGNGRTGRALWAWQMVRQKKRRFSAGPHGEGVYGGLDWSSLERGFLHEFYYQALEAPRYMGR